MVEIFVVLLWSVLVLGAYLVPSIVAVLRQVPNLGSVIVVNVFLGWSLVGWVAALAMATRSAGPAVAPVHIINTNTGSPPPGPERDQRWG